MVNIRRFLLLSCLALALVSLTPPKSKAQAQDAPIAFQKLEEIVVTFNVPRLFQRDMFVMYDGKTVYLPMTEVFELLDFSVTPDFQAKKLVGFIMNRNNTFELDFSLLTARMPSKEVHFDSSDFVLSATDVFLRLELFETLFDLHMDFSFTQLQVQLPLDTDFPAWQRLQRKSARDKMLAKKEALERVKAVPHQRKLFKAGVVDWMLSTNPIGGGGHYLNLDIGSIVAGGDLYLSGGGNTVTGFEAGNTIYRWHYFVNNNPYLTQIGLGQVYSTGSLSRSFTGATFTNRPQVQRSYFRQIDVTGFVGEGWEVELFVDNQLIAFSFTDLKGEYHFDLDQIYGSSQVLLKMYGPNGEFKQEERTLNVPYTLLPKGAVEYATGFGYTGVRDSAKFYSQGQAYAGITSFLTAGVMGDFPIASADSELSTFAGELTTKINNEIMLGGGFAPNYVTSGALSFNRPSLASMNFNISKYYENKWRNPAKQEQRINASISLPLRLFGKYIGARYSVSIDKFATVKATNMNFGMSTSLLRTFINYMGKYKISENQMQTQKGLSSQLLMSTQMLRLFWPQVRLDYDHSTGIIDHYGIFLNKRILRTGQLTLSYERNVPANTNSIMLNFSFFTGFAQVTSRAQRIAKNFYVSQVQRGSIQYDQDVHHFRFDRRSSVGYGVAVVRPFMDDNDNGKREDNEALLPGVKAKISGANGIPTGKNKTYYYNSLRPYDNYIVQVDQYSIDNPTLKPTNENYSVTINPNMVNAIEIPIVTVSDVSGLIERQTPQGNSGTGGIKLLFTNISKEVTTLVQTFSNGEYYYLGLLPGMYRAEVDPAQLTKYGYVTEPLYREFEIKPGSSGMSLENISFLLVPKK
jgi:hypothetical protein